MKTRDSADLTLVHVSVSNPATVPSGALYVASTLAGKGYRVDFRDFTARSYWHLDPAGLASSLAESADTVGIGCMSDTLPFVIDALRHLKARSPEKKVILGGPGPTGVAREIIEAFPFVDIVVVGEGERTALEVMDALSDGQRDRSNLHKVRGICFRDGADAVATPARDRIRDLDDLPLPLYEAVPIEKYPMVNIVFSRGCPYRCTFCDVAPMWQRKNLRRSVESLIDEIRFLVTKYGRTRFEFTDETFILSQDKIMDFCERVKRGGLGIKWSCTGRVNLVTKELLAEMASAGCEAMFFGIESGSDQVLKRVNKDFSVAEAVEAIHTTSGYMKPVASFIWGFPFETGRDLGETLFLMVYLSQLGADCRLNRLAPFPLMPLYQEYRSEIAWRDKDGSYSDREPFETAGYPAAVVDLVRSNPGIFPSFYRFPTEDLEPKNRMIGLLGRYWQAADWLDDPMKEAAKACRNTI